MYLSVNLIYQDHEKIHLPSTHYNLCNRTIRIYRLGIPRRYICENYFLAFFYRITYFMSRFGAYLKKNKKFEIERTTARCSGIIFISELQYEALYRGPNL